MVEMQFTEKGLGIKIESVFKQGEICYWGGSSTFYFLSNNQTNKQKFVLKLGGDYVIYFMDSM